MAGESPKSPEDDWFIPDRAIKTENEDKFSHASVADPTGTTVVVGLALAVGGYLVARWARRAVAALLGRWSQAAWGWAGRQLTRVRWVALGVGLDAGRRPVHVRRGRPDRAGTVRAARRGAHPGRSHARAATRSARRES